MKLRVVFVAALAAVVALCVVGLAAGAGAVKKPSGTTFHLVEKDAGFNFVDNKPLGGENEPPSMGDMFVFEATLLTRANKRAGTLYATCIVASGGKNGKAECTGTFTLAGGQLALQTVIGLSENGDRPDQIAIVGGTGAYEGARGSIKSVSRGANSPYSDDTIHLLPKNV